MRRTHGASHWLTDQEEHHLDKYDKPDVFRLASYRKSISNFVSILSGRKVPVYFKGEGGRSYTDNEHVVISANISPYNFDAIVGTALHEASHMLLTDFNIIKNNVKMVNKEIDLVWKAKGLGIDNRTEYDENKNMTRMGTVASHIKRLVNIFEDRRIDRHTYDSHPGYKIYYKAMYREYWKSERIDKIIKDPKAYNTNTVDSYMFYLMNLVNKNINLDLLPGLRACYRLVDLDNIDRFASTKDIFDLSLQLYDIILDNIDREEQAKENEANAKAEALKDEMAKAMEKLLRMLGEAAEGMSDEELKKLLEDIEGQGDFVDGNLIKINLPDGFAARLKALRESSSKLVSLDPKGVYAGTECLVVKKVTDDMLDGSVFETFESGLSWQTDIQAGVVLGKLLGKKLKLRNETKETRFTRKKAGSLNKRMLHEVAFGNVNIFDQLNVESYQDALLYIDIDASGSMDGEKWKRTVTSVVAISVAAKASKNIDVVLCARGCQTVGGESVPIVVVLYDSRRDTIARLRLVLAHTHCNSSTPEGLCFEASIKELFRPNSHRKLYFLNFSDGGPCFSNRKISYSGAPAHEHTRTMVNKIRKMGIEVLSYYIGGGWGGGSTAFTTMYGSDARFINVTNIIEVAHTLNKKFLDK